MHDGVASSVALELWELQAVDGVLYHGWHLICCHILVGVILIGRFSGAAASISTTIVSSAVIFFVRKVKLKSIISTAG